MRPIVRRKIARGPAEIVTVLAGVSGVVAIPEVTGLQQHGVARVEARPFGEDTGLAARLNDAREFLAVRARRKANVHPVAVRHIVEIALLDNVQITQWIDFHLIGVRCNQFLNDIAYGLFVARRAVGFGKLLN